MCVYDNVDFNRLRITSCISVPFCSRSLMDRMLACEAGDSGSTPDESTKTNVVRFCALVTKRSFVSGVDIPDDSSPLPSHLLNLVYVIPKNIYKNPWLLAYIINLSAYRNYIW